MLLKRRFLLTAVIAVLMTGLFLPDAAAQAHMAWFAPLRVDVRACKDGLKIRVFNLRASAGPTEIKVESVGRALDNSANINLPSSEPIDYTTFSHSPFIAGSGNNAYSVSATEYLYFAKEQPLRNNILTSIGIYTNGALVGEPMRLSSPITTCLMPAMPAYTTDLSGALLKGQTDARAQPLASDSMAIYCIVVGNLAGTIVVDGINANGGFRGNEFKQSLIESIYPNGVSRPAFDGRGTIVLRGAGSSYRAEWINGPGGFYQAKEFNCAFDKSKYNKTKTQLDYSTGFGSDGRIDPNPVDRVAIYCEISGALAGSIRVVGIDANSQGYALGTFKYKDILKVSPNPVIRNAQVGSGTVSLRVDDNDNYVMEWVGGEWGNQSKAFQCHF